tara:strand:+ start:6322 stop:6525 length:204 start_codon:yes stop_codon:yes gene_type:complete
MIKDRMGKMKQLQQAMLEDNWKGTPEDYLKWWINKESKKIDKRNENNNSNTDSNNNICNESERKSIK